MKHHTTILSVVFLVGVSIFPGGPVLQSVGAKPDQAEPADLLGKKDEAAAFRKEATELARIINEKMWDSKRKFYFDLTVDGKQSPAKTIAAFWMLLAGVASPEQADALAAELSNPKSFGRKHRVSTTPAAQRSLGAGRSDRRV